MHEQNHQIFPPKGLSDKASLWIQIQDAKEGTEGPFQEEGLDFRNFAQGVQEDERAD